MSSWYQSYTPSFETLTRTANLSVATQRHLRDVYFQLSLMLGACAAGAYAVLVNLWQMSQLTFLASLGCLAGFHFLTPTKDNEAKRQALLLAFAFTQGLCIGPLLQISMYINPSVVTLALIYTTLVFVCFTMAALFSARRSYIYLGGILSSAVTVLLFLNFANIFIGSRAMANVELWGGLLVFAAYVAYDSQIIVEKAELGSRDHLGHALCLFADAYNIFARLLVILGKKEERKKREDRKKRAF